MEIWPSAVVVRAHLLGFEPSPGELNPCGQFPLVLRRAEAQLEWIATTVGGGGTQRPVEWTFVAPQGTGGGQVLSLEWSDTAMQPPSGRLDLSP